MAVTDTLGNGVQAIHDPGVQVGFVNGKVQITANFTDSTLHQDITFNVPVDVLDELRVPTNIVINNLSHQSLSGFHIAVDNNHPGADTDELHPDFAHFHGSSIALNSSGYATGVDFTQVFAAGQQGVALPAFTLHQPDTSDGDIFTLHLVANQVGAAPVAHDPFAIGHHA
jgi:hypothetical protein